MAPAKKTANPAPNVIKGQPLPNNDPIEDDSLISEADLNAKKSRLITELVSERKKVEQLNKEVNKKIREQVATVSKFQGVIKARDELLLAKEVILAQQKSSVEIYKGQLAAQEETHKAQKLILTTEHDAATARLRAQLLLSRTEAKSEKTKASVSNRDYSISADKVNKLQLDLEKSRRDCDDFAAHLRDAKLEVGQAKKLITTISKRVDDQHKATLAHKERMKEFDIEKERIKFEKQKETTKSRMIIKQRDHHNSLARTDHRYHKADTSSTSRHNQKKNNENEKVNTACARAAQAAATVQQSQNAGHFPNPRGVDLERVSFLVCDRLFSSMLLTLLLLLPGHGPDAQPEFHHASAYTDADGIRQTGWEEIPSSARRLAEEHQ
jgi:hypothetical protein